ncbi:MAG: hypothetical protein JXB03_05700 [Spirochaetales bacterium]|nr:hypothetical protein [Spirochaetales bacterium]
MGKNTTPRAHRARNTILVILVLLVLLPLGAALLTLIGRVSPFSVLPGEHIAYLHVPNPVSSADRLIRHQALEEILSLPEFSAAAPVVRGLAESRILANPLLKAALNGDMDGAVYDDGAYIFSWDLGFASALLKIVPAVVSRMNIPGLYYVQAGKLSRFEYRPDNASTVYIGLYRNLAVVADSRDAIEAILSESTPPSDTAENSEPQRFQSSGFDAGIKVRGESLISMFMYQDPKINELLSHIALGETAEAAVTLEEDRILIHIGSRVATRIPQLNTLLDRESYVPAILDILPSTTQYATIMSMASVRDLVDLAQAVQGPALGTLLARADTASSMLLGVSIDDLLYSWTGEETAVFGLEGRPKPVFAIRIANEAARKQVFESLLSSFALSGDNSVVLDGVRVPRIRMPDFLAGILSIWDIRIPSPYYLVENGFLLLSESPENLLETATARRRNATLLRTETWDRLSTGTSDESGLSLFYSLDRSVPFFLKGNDALAQVLKLYGKGLAKMSVHDSRIQLSLSARTTRSMNPTPLGGFPVKIQGRIGSTVNVLSLKGETVSRFLYTVNGKVLESRNYHTGETLRYEASDPLYAALFSQEPPTDLNAPAVWTLSERGVAALLDGGLSPVEGFPLATGIPVSAAPVVHDGALYITGSDASLWRITKEGTKERISLPFTQVLRSAPAFSGSGRKAVMAMYPKSFAGKLWLTDTDGSVKDGWPVSVSGIAFGSPLPFTYKRDLHLAFLTQAGELSLLKEDGSAAAGFPVSLPGIFYLQPVWDGTYLWALASDGSVFRVGMDAMYDSRKLQGLAAKNGTLIVETGGEKSIENPRIFISGEGNLLYGLSRDFAPLPGFPVKGWGTPWIGDLEGDGYTDCVSAGLDNTLYGWRFK